MTPSPLKRAIANEMHPHFIVHPPVLPTLRNASASPSRRPVTCETEPLPSARKKRVQLLPPPSETPALLRKPEAVVVATAAGLFMLADSALRSVRIAFASIAARTAILGEARRNELWREKRRRECEFLESAVTATEATLENTRRFLTAQRVRADAAEKTLEKIAARRQQLDEAARELRERKKEMIEKECELEEERRKRGVKDAVLVEMEAEMQKGREGVAALEKLARRERDLLKEAGTAQRKKLAGAQRETSRLETLLFEKKSQLERELAERELYFQRHIEAERTLEVASGSLEVAVSDLENRRKRIEDMEAEARVVETQAKRKQEGINAVLMGDVGVDEIKRSIATVKQQQEMYAEAMKAGSETYEAKLSEISEMKDLLEKRDAQLQQLRVKMQGTVARGASQSKEKVIGVSQIAEETREEAVSKAARSTSFTANGDTSKSGDAETNQGSVDIDMDAAQLLLSSTMIRSDAKDQGVAAVVGTTALAVDTGRHRRQSQGNGVELAQVVENARSSAAPAKSESPEVKPKRRRGRPRKSETSAASEKESLQPKRRRGRPRNVEADAIVAAKETPKRKRGRPRKNAPTAPN